MSATSEQQTIARAFLAARESRTPLADYPGAIPLTMGDAYSIQSAAIALDGRAVGGWKVGRIAPDLVAHYASDRIAGPIFADEIAENGAAMPVYVGGFAAAEAEVLLRFGAIGDREYDLDTVRSCIAEVRTGIEIASSPFGGINRYGPAVTASDYGNNNGLVLGPPIDDWRERDLIRMPVEMFVDGALVGAATMEGMLDGPFGSALFLIRTLRARGLAIEPDTWVSAGAITGIHEVRPGQRAEALFDKRIRVGCSIKSY